MKHKHFKHLFTALMLLCAITVNAHDFEVDGIYYNILSEADKTVEVTYYGSNFNTQTNDYYGHVTIPETVTNGRTTYTVVAIGEYTFAMCEKVTGVTIPSTIKRIGTAAFGVNEAGGVDFSNVYITDIDAWFKIDFGNAASSPLSYAENFYLNGELITNIVIPEGIEEIKNFAFYGFSGEVNLTIPSSVKKIAGDAFYLCSNIKNIIVAEDNVIYDSRESCNAIIETATNTLILGGSNSTVPNGVEFIGGGAFRNCVGLKSIVIPGTVNNILGNAFNGCTNLKTIYNYSSLDISVGSIDNGYIAYYANSVITKTDDIQGDYVFRVIDEIPTLISYIGDDVEITLPSDFNGNNYEIGPDVFKNYSNIQSVTILNGVTNIGAKAFYNCRNLRFITIPETLSKIDAQAFEYCTNLNIIYNYSSLDISVGSNDNGYIARYANSVITKTDDIQGDYVFRKSSTTNTLVAYIGDDTVIYLPDNYNGENYSIANKVFRGMPIVKVTIPQSVTSIGYEAFQECSNLVSVLNFSGLRLAKGSTDNGYVAYYAQKVVNAPNGSIEDDFIFSVIDGVNTLVHCNSVSSSFEDWTSTNKSNSSSSSKIYTFMAEVGDILTFDWMVSSEKNYDIFTITINGTRVLEKSGEESGSYKYTFASSGEYTLIARYSKDDSDKSGSNCGKIYNILFSGAKTVDIVLPDNYKGENYVIGSEVFKSCNLRSVVIPECVTRIGDNAFSGSLGLISVTSNAVEAPELGIDAFASISSEAILYYPYFSDYSAWVSNFSSVKKITPTVAITINQYGNATYCSPYALDFSDVEGLKAYAATGYDTATQVVTLTRVQSTKGGTGLFLKAEPGEYVIPVIENSSYNTLNLLVGTLEQTTVNSTAGEMSNYKFTIANGDAAPMFYPFEDNTTFSAGKAYLQIPTAWLPAIAQKSLSIRFDDGETTDIDEVKEQRAESKDVYYDLSGRVVENPTRGIYIIDGKKVLVK